MLLRTRELAGTVPGDPGLVRGRSERDGTGQTRASRPGSTAKGGGNHAYLGGVDPRTGEAFVFYEYPAGGTGAWDGGDGNNTVRAFTLLDPARAGRHHIDDVGEEQGLLDVVGDEANGLVVAFPPTRRGAARRAPSRHHGRTRIFACCSGEPSASKAPATPSIPTLPVMSGATGIAPAAMWPRVAANSSWV